MPWIEVHERHEKVQTNRCCGRDDQIREDVVANRFLGFGILELLHNNEDRGESRVGHDNAVSGHTRQEHLLGSLRSVTHR